MTDWENYTKLCNLKDSIFSICPSIQTSNYRHFHRLMYQTPYDYMDNAFLTHTAITYSDIHFSPRLRDNELITDLIDTPPQVLTSGMAMTAGRVLSVSGSFMLGGGGFPHGIIQESLGRTSIDTNVEFPRRDDFDNSSSLKGKFIRKIKMVLRK